MSSVIQLSQDLSQMEEYQPLPAGPYVAEVRDVEIGYSEKLPNGYFKIALLVPVENFPADYDVGNAPQGVPITYARVQVPDPNNRRTVGPFKNWLRAVGGELAGTEVDPQDWIGKEVQVVLSVNMYQGAPVNNVEMVGPVADV
jgi:hypothetical protein